MGIVQHTLPVVKFYLFYVYILYRPDGRPFYVGKGSKDRVKDHDREAKRGCRCHKCNVIRKIWQAGEEMRRYVVFESYNEAEAFAMERYLIASIGREHLTNATDGGEGASGVVWTQETRDKVQAAKIGRPRSEECKAKIRAKLTGRKLPREHVEHAAAGNRGKVRTPEWRQHVSEVQKGRKRPWQNGERHHGAVLTEERVRMMRRLLSVKVPHRILADIFGVKRSQINRIAHRQSWAWLED